MKTDTIHYSMRNLKARKYQLEIDLKNMEATGMTAFLKDNYTGTVTTLDYNNPYTLTFTPTNAAPGSYAADRFKIYFQAVECIAGNIYIIGCIQKKQQYQCGVESAKRNSIQHYEVESSADGINFSKLNQCTGKQQHYIPIG